MAGPELSDSRRGDSLPEDERGVVHAAITPKGEPALLLTPAAGTPALPQAPFVVTVRASPGAGGYAVDIHDAPGAPRAFRLALWRLRMALSMLDGLRRLPQVPLTKATLEVEARALEWRAPQTAAKTTPPAFFGEGPAKSGLQRRIKALVALAVALGALFVPGDGAKQAVRAGKDALEEVLDAGRPEARPLLLDGEQLGEKTIPLYEGQARPPCKGVAVELGGGCWVALDAKPPCQREHLEYAGKCWLPMGGKARREDPNSLQRLPK